MYGQLSSQHRSDAGWKIRHRERGGMSYQQEA